MSATSTSPLRNHRFAERGWYPHRPEQLTALLSDLMPSSDAPGRRLGVVSPHAGYRYSGAVAGALFASTEVPARVVVLAPKHTRYGANLALMARGTWRLPNGDLRIDEEAASRIAEAAPELDEDAVAHAEEHSLELQLPFVLARNPDAQIVPICLGRMSLEACTRLGSRMGRAIAGLEGPTLIVASSDMNHQEPKAETNRKDKLAIDQMLAFDPDGLYRTVAAEDITMCGVIPTVVMMNAVRELGATSAELVRYADSADAGGDPWGVVGYAAVAFA